MTRHPRLRDTRKVLVVFGIVPCLLGVGLGQYLRWNGSVWLTDAGGFWPIFCALASLLSCAYLALTTEYDRTMRVSAWLMLSWTCLYFPLWLTAMPIARSSALIGNDGRVSIVSDWIRPGTDRVWLIGGRSGNKIIRNTEGLTTINGVDVKYKFAASYISAFKDDDDLSKQVVDTVTAALAVVATRSKMSRIELFDSKDAQARFLANTCAAVVRGKVSCPLKLTISANSVATIPGGLWSQHFTEREAIDERYLPALVNLLTQDNARLVRKDEVFALFMELAKDPADFAKVAHKSHLLDNKQFDALIERISTAPEAGNEALAIYASVSRLSHDQRGKLRAIAFHQAGIDQILKRHRPGRIADSELVELSTRLLREWSLNPEVATLALEAFGERLPRDLQASAVDSITRSGASHALTALRHLDFSSPLREVLLRKVIDEAGLKELDANLTHGRLDELLTPPEARLLVASVIKKAGVSKEWLNFAVRMLPVRMMTPKERKVITDELMFMSLKSALEFVSENRQYLDATDVHDVTRDYAKTIAPDFCLHLTHRNANRQTDYFDEAQVGIFRACAQAK